MLYLNDVPSQMKLMWLNTNPQVFGRWAGAGMQMSSTTNKNRMQGGESGCEKPDVNIQNHHVFTDGETTTWRQEFEIKKGWGWKCTFVFLKATLLMSHQNRVCVGKAFSLLNGCTSWFLCWWKVILFQMWVQRYTCGCSLRMLQQLWCS